MISTFDEIPSVLCKKVARHPFGHRQPLAALHGQHGADHRRRARPGRTWFFPTENGGFKPCLSHVNHEWSVASWRIVHGWITKGMAKSIKKSPEAQRKYVVWPICKVWGLTNFQSQVLPTAVWHHWVYPILGAHKGLTRRKSGVSDVTPLI